MKNKPTITYEEIVAKIKANRVGYVDVSHPKETPNFYDSWAFNILF